MKRLYNFCAGPAMLPQAVMQQAQAEMLDWRGTGCSVMEISHRSDEFIQLAEQAEQDLRDLLAIPEHYKVLFCQGGGRGQFAAVPLNLTQSKDDVADYLISGSWSKGAFKEANTFIKANALNDNPQAALDPKGWQPNPNAKYLHYCDNETVDGVALDYIPHTQAPLVVDMSSSILSRPIDVERFGVIYAGAQKNIGPSGLSVVIVRDDLLHNARQATPAILNYATLAANGSMYNTPPTFAWYLAGLVFQWLKAEGGVEEMARRSQAKSGCLYQAIDNSDFYINRISPENRSVMNIPFQLARPELDTLFLHEAEQVGLKALAGHRSVGGMRASLYNAMPLSGVQALVEFMTDFERNHA